MPVLIGGNTVAESSPTSTMAISTHGSPLRGRSYLKLADADHRPASRLLVSITTAPAGPETLTGAPVSVDECPPACLPAGTWSHRVAATPIPLTDLSDGDSGALQDDTIYGGMRSTKYELVVSDGDLVPARVTGWLHRGLRPDDDRA